MILKKPGRHSYAGLPQTGSHTADKLSNTELKQALANLDRLLYTEQPDSWQGHRFWKIFHQASGAAAQGAAPKASEDPLPTLYR